MRGLSAIPNRIEASRACFPFRAVLRVVQGAKPGASTTLSAGMVSDATSIDDYRSFIAHAVQASAGVDGYPASGYPLFIGGALRGHNTLHEVVPPRQSYNFLVLLAPGTARPPLR